MRKLIAGTVGAAIALTGLVGLAGTASADSASQAVITRDTTGYLAPTKESLPVMTGLAQGQKVNALCFTDDGAEVNGNKYWFRISKTETPDKTAFVPQDALIGDTSGLRHCFPKG